MSQILKFDPDANKPHISGPAKCTKPVCLHEWVATTVDDGARGQPLECPECHLMSGFYHMYSPHDEALIFECNCGCDVFFVTKTGIYCVGCSNETTYAELAEDE